MTKRGFASVAGNPDLLINIGILVENIVQTCETNWQTDGRYAYMGQRNYSWKSQEVEVGRYSEGTATLHVVDAAKNSRLWKGSANGIVPEKEKNLPEAVETGMTELFKKFPVPVK